MKKIILQRRSQLFIISEFVYKKKSINYMKLTIRSIKLPWLYSSGRRKKKEKKTCVCVYFLFYFNVKVIRLNK